MATIELQLKRIYTCSTYTIGHLYVNGKYFCDTLEDADRGAKQTDPLAAIQAVKVYGKTAIPKGTYKVTMNVRSPKYYAKASYKAFCNGYMPRLLSVPAYDGVLIHAGNTAEDTLGCILVGLNKVKGKVLESRATWEKLMTQYLLPAKKNGTNIQITITSNYKK